MQGKLNMIKNLAWALAIAVVLLALLLALLFTAFTRYGGELERPVVVLGADATNGSQAVEQVAKAVQTETGTLFTLSETPDAGTAYIDSLTFLCDSATIGLRDYGILKDGYKTTQVWGGISGSLPVDQLIVGPIRYPVDGSSLTPGQAAMVAKPSILVISVGQDGLMNVDKDSFLQYYEGLITSIRNTSPGTVIICCSITSLGPNYAGVDRLTNDAIAWANDWVQQACVDTGAYYCDVAHDMRDNTNVLNVNYAAANLKTLNSEGLSAFLMYLRTHAVQ